MGISIFKKPKKMAAEEWIEVIAETIDINYGVIGGYDTAKQALFNAMNAAGGVEATLTYKAFTDELRHPNEENDAGYEVDKSVLATAISPMLLKGNDWTEKFDDDEEEGIGLEGLSPRAFARALKDSYDQGFTDFVTILWLKVNVPNAYDIIKASTEDSLIPPSVFYEE